MPTIHKTLKLRAKRRPFSLPTVMHLLYLEALGALLILIFIIWWTMFSGRKNGELPDEVEREKAEGAKKKTTSKDQSS